MSSRSELAAIMAASTQFDFLAPARLPDPRAAISQATRLAETLNLPGRMAWLRAAASQVAALPSGILRQDLEKALALLARLMADDGQISTDDHCQLQSARPAWESCADGKVTDGSSHEPIFDETELGAASLAG